MDVQAQLLLPNNFELDELPYFRIEELPLEHTLTAKRMSGLRNATYRHQGMLAKIFAYFPKSYYKPGSEETLGPRMILVQEMPVLSLEDYVYWLSSLSKKAEICNKQWNQLVGQAEQVKQESHKLVDRLLMGDEQLRMESRKNVQHFVYYDLSQKCFRIKVSFRNLNFEVASSFGKVKAAFNFEQGFSIKNQVIATKLMQRLREKLQTTAQQKSLENQHNKLKARLQVFYERDFKRMDENLLQLKLKANYPVLRQKRFFPVQFVDGLDGQKLVEPIVSNKNKHCMFGHFSGYNSNNFTRLQNTSCQFCGIQIKQIQENKLLMFLRNNIFNPAHEPILYCPEFNRFKIIRKRAQGEVEQARRNLQTLRIASKQSERTEIIDQQQPSQGSQMKNQSEDVQKKTPSNEIVYSSYMHLCSNLKSMYPLNKSRIKIQSKKEIEHVSYVYKLGEKHDRHGFNKYFRPFLLCDPARGKFCAHMEFADLRLFYSTAIMQDTMFVSEAVYTCPICHEEVKDSELIYLKQVVVLVKYIRKLLEPEPDDPLLASQPKGKVDPNTIRIIINNVQKKVFVQYFTEHKGKTKKGWVEIEKMYSTLLDPYVPFSQYSLGLHRKNKKLEAVYNFGNAEPESDTERLQREWLGQEANTLLI